MDENDDAVNQPNQIKGKNKLVHDLKQFWYKNQLLIKIHFFYMLHIKWYIMFLTGSYRRNHEDGQVMKHD